MVARVIAALAAPPIRYALTLQDPYCRRRHACSSLPEGAGHPKAIFRDDFARPGEQTCTRFKEFIEKRGCETKA